MKITFRDEHMYIERTNSDKDTALVSFLEKIGFTLKRHNEYYGRLEKQPFLPKGGWIAKLNKKWKKG